MKKRVISWLLTVVMVVSLLPTSVLADTLAADQEQQTQQEQTAPADTDSNVPTEDEETQEQQEPAEEVPVSRFARSGGAALALAEGTVSSAKELLSIIIKRTETQLSRLCVFSLLQPHRTEVRLTGKYRYLTFEDRKKIEAWHLLGDRPVDIAARLSVHHTTIYKELQRGATGALDANQREGYSAELAERRLRESFKRRGKRAPAAQ